MMMDKIVLNSVRDERYIRYLFDKLKSHFNFLQVTRILRVFQIVS